MSDELLRRSLEEYDPSDFRADEDFNVEQPKDDRQVTAMLRQVSWIDAEIARIAAVAQEQIEHANSWRDDMASGLKCRRESLLRALEGFARARKRKTTPYPYGTLKLRAQRFVVVVDDEAALIAHLLPPRVLKIVHALSQSELLNVTVSPVRQNLGKMKAAKETDVDTIRRVGRAWCEQTKLALAEPNVEVMALADADGQIIPGVHLVRQLDDRFSLSTSTTTTGESADGND